MNTQAESGYTPPDRIRHPKKRIALRHYALCGAVHRACAAAQIHPSTWYEWRKRDPDFVEEIDVAREFYTQRLEAEADRRAVEGVRRLKFGKDGQPLVDPRTGEFYEERLYSDTLLIFRLKALRPEVYRERYEVKRSDAEIDKEIESQLESLAAKRQSTLTRAQPNGHESNGDDDHHSNGKP